MLSLTVQFLQGAALRLQDNYISETRLIAVNSLKTKRILPSTSSLFPVEYYTNSKLKRVHHLGNQFDYSLVHFPSLQHV